METAGLTDLLKQEGSYTIFAPTDDAFAGLSKEDFALLRSEYSEIQKYPHLRWIGDCCQACLYQFKVFECWNKDRKISRILVLLCSMKIVFASLCHWQVIWMLWGSFCSTTSAMASSSMEDWREESPIFSKPSRATTFKLFLYVQSSNRWAVYFCPQNQGDRTDFPKLSTIFAPTDATAQETKQIKSAVFVRLSPTN